MASEAIGRIKCPCCSSGKARVTVSKGGRCVVTCSACHVQMFCRSDYSDTLVRSNMTPIEKIAEAESAAPRPVEPAPGEEIVVPGVIAEREAVAAVAAPVEEKPAAPKKRGAWDIFGG